MCWMSDVIMDINVYNSLYIEGYLLNAKLHSGNTE